MPRPMKEVERDRGPNVGSQRSSRIIRAKGEQEASRKLSEAADVIAASPGVLELRRLQTLTEIGVEHNSTIIAMLPVELIHAARKIAGMAPTDGSSE